MRFATTTACVLALGFSTTAFAAEPTVIEWNALIPEVEPYENPFADLDQSDIRSLAKLLRLESLLEDKEDPQIRAEATELRAGLTERGLDVDGLFAQRLVVMENRIKAARSPNPEIVGQSVRLPGYILPLEFKGEEAVEFLLVPTVGACIHTPPPDANQIVHVTYPKGIKVDGMFEPIWIAGQMQSEFATENLYMVDGTTEVEITYQMSADLVEPYK
ncbi:DUF3299 domain-containing protein [Shimia aestuarii]|uniref:DUF3299 domain-containing protein n=1 Tax=Shimia aestuarii TaxID=254406 RepID=A0A1I4KF02_9RHOB|nr:DUF3299 domain-containing protein [Shimia aestuarii]SFL77173.1 hypothetical protein SAMN04488042_1011446 [Shimia aestuarii]